MVGEDAQARELMIAMARATPLDLPPTPKKPKGLRVAVLAHPHSDPDDTEDVELVKSALLYADHITLYSPVSNMGMVMRQVRDNDVLSMIKLMEEVAPVLSTEDATRELRQAIRTFYKKLQSCSAWERRALLTYAETQFKEIMADLRQVAGEQAERVGADEIYQISKAGYLAIHRFRNFDDTGALVWEFFDTIDNSLCHPSVYPLLDEGTARLARAGVNEGYISISDTGLARSRHCALAADLMERLPSFELASVSELLDIRKELDGPLRTFRSAVMGFSESVTSAVWDADFEHEANMVFMKSIEPAVAELEEKTRANKYLSALLPTLVDKDLASRSCLALALTSKAVLANEVAQRVVIAATVASYAYQAHQTWAKERAAIAGNQVYFYYQAGERLQRLRGARRRRK